MVNIYLKQSLLLAYNDNFTVLRFVIWNILIKLFPKFRSLCELVCVNPGHHIHGENALLPGYQCWSNNNKTIINYRYNDA